MSSFWILDSLSTFRTFAINPWVNGAILGIMVLGVFISFRVLDIADLSVEGVLPMVTMLTAVMINVDVNPWLVLLICACIGAICGILNALLTLYLKVPPLLSGIIIMALTFGIAIMINSLKSGQASFDGNSHLTVFNWLRNLFASGTTDRVGLFYASYFSYIIVAVLILVLLWFVLYFFFGTELGMSIRASGKNKAMSRASGISTNKMTIIAMAISGALIGIASSLYGQHNCMGIPTDGQGMIVVALSSLFLGELIFGRRTFKRSMLSALVGSILYWYVIQALMLLDRDGYMLSVFKAILLVLIIAIQYGVAKWKKRHPKNPSGAKPGNGEETPEGSVESAYVQSFARHCLGGKSHA